MPMSGELTKSHTLLLRECDSRLGQEWHGIITMWNLPYQPMPCGAIGHRWMQLLYVPSDANIVSSASMTIHIM